MLFTIRVQCGCGCQSKFAIQWHLTGKGEEFTIAPSWEEPTKLTVSHLPGAFTYIQQWAERGGKIANLIFERVDCEEIPCGSISTGKERTATPVLQQEGFCICGW